MRGAAEGLLVRAWNYFTSRHPTNPTDLALGRRLVDGTLTRVRVSLPHARRPEHIAVLGKTGSGKSSLLRYWAAQDIRARRGFVFFDLHGDATPAILKEVASEEQRRKVDLSGNLIIIDPSDRKVSVGLNILEGGDEQSGYVQIAEIAALLRDRWHLDTLGVRTEELLRCGLLLLRDNGFTILELSLLLTNTPFRLSCLRYAKNPEAKTYFETRFEPLSEPMKGIYREAVLNKLTAFTADPHFRHVLGQRSSTFDLRAAVDEGCWIIVNLDKGKLGEQAATLGSLLLSRIKHTLFGRSSRRLLTLYCDELQNLVPLAGGLESLLAEARKLGVSVVSANQYLEQYPGSMRAAVLAVGTLALFQLSSSDAERLGSALGGGRYLRETLRNLPKRELLVKSGSLPYEHVRVPELELPRVRSESLRHRSNARFARSREAVEEHIQILHGVAGKERNLDAWD